MTTKTGREQREPKQRHAPLEEALGDAGAALEARLLDVDEREARDRAGVHARTGDIGERGGNHQVDVGALDAQAIRLISEGPFGQSTRR